tara:strand:+ start:2345 stop:4093 length:1749 start_codon:yes stop_codon:yes gene_type:complete
MLTNNRITAKQILQQLSTVEKTTILSSETVKKLGFDIEDTVAKITLDFIFDKEIKDVFLHIVLKKNFPILLPLFYLTKESYNLLKYIPHVDSNRLVCTYETDSIIIDQKDPYGVLNESLIRVKKIINEGIRKENFDDFEEEFLAYWNDQYNGGLDCVNIVNFLSLLHKEIKTEFVDVLLLKQKYVSLEYILCHDIDEEEEFKLFLDSEKIKFETRKCLYLGEINFLKTPPFTITNKVIDDILEQVSPQIKVSYIKYINNEDFPKIILFKKIVNTETYYLGWYYSSISKKIPGFRKESLNNFDILKNNLSTKFAKRFTPKRFTKERLRKRTSGIILSSKNSFCVAGLGSIGSNLIYFLNAMTPDELKLIDYDILTEENIGRHLLGFEYISNYKTKSFFTYLKGKNPLQKITTKEASIIDIINEDIDFINNNDALFIAIGNYNVEQFIIEKINSGLIKVKCFILWVEPYLAGGHCIYINPKKKISTNFYDANCLFSQNIISDKEYIKNNPKLKLIEAGCQSGFTPYSQANVTIFLSMLYPKLIKLLYENHESKLITWVGDKKNIENLNIEISDFGKNHKSLSII